MDQAPMATSQLPDSVAMAIPTIGASALGTLPVDVMCQTTGVMLLVGITMPKPQVLVPEAPQGLVLSVGKE